MSMLERTFFATASMYRNSVSLATKARIATHNAMMCTCAIDEGFSSLRSADHNMPSPTDNKSAPSAKVAPVSKR